MKHKLLLTALLLMPCITVNADNLLKVQLADGSSVSIPFAAKPEVSYPTYNTITIGTTEGKTTYEFDGAITFTYETGAPTGMEGIAADVRITDGQILVSGLKAGQTVTLYSVNGAALRSVRANANGMAVVKTDDLQSAAIIVKTPTSSFKVKK